ncbi:PrgI family protein [Actinoalloteichus fjordicus]|uniref:PrgI family protein n=1 Tax=Actinoalloteichus fjordicus TaxID=1612552 RepID=A0AAC9LCW8_9PSEU|nr:PrgI family protein [Actinoalloteichus fjordicus]APU15297.1 PrgI family protein [Actinoalloteichus fjordicus]
MTSPVRIPADVDRPDQVVGTLTARQLAILAVTGIVLYGTWTSTRELVPLPVFLALGIPIGVAAAVIALGRRDGITLDRLLVAAWRQRRTPALRVAAPEGIRPAPDWLTARASSVSGSDATTQPAAPAELRLPAHGVTDAGVIDLGRDGLAAVATCGAVNFALRTPTEQESLVATFGRYLHSLTAPVQILIRAEHLDLSPQISELRERAPTLPHPALEDAAREHADYLVHLDTQADLLRRQILLILREPVHTTTDPGLGGASPTATLTGLVRRRSPTLEATEAARRAAEARLLRRVNEAAELFTPAGIVVTPLDAGQATAVLAAACDPDSLIPASASLAGADDVITSEPTPDVAEHDPAAYGDAVSAEVDDGPRWAG